MSGINIHATASVAMHCPLLHEEAKAFKNFSVVLVVFKRRVPVGVTAALLKSSVLQEAIQCSIPRPEPPSVAPGPGPQGTTAPLMKLLPRPNVHNAALPISRGRVC